MLGASSPIEMYVTIGLGTSVSENYFFTIVLGIFVYENYTWPFPKNDPEGRINATSLKQTKSTVKCIEKIHALEYKSNFIDTYF